MIIYLMRLIHRKHYRGCKYHKNEIGRPEGRPTLS